MITLEQFTKGMKESEVKNYSHCPKCKKITHYDLLVNNNKSGEQGCIRCIDLNSF